MRWAGQHDWEYRTPPYEMSTTADREARTGYYFKACGMGPVQRDYKSPHKPLREYAREQDLAATCAEFRVLEVMES